MSGSSKNNNLDDKRSSANKCAAMIETVEELKALISWLKEQKVKRLKLGDVEVEISDIAFVDLGEQLATDISQSPVSDLYEENVSPPPSEVKEDEEMLFWSARS